jgi:PPP family 3-phenylpropionic acid transporter
VPLLFVTDFTTLLVVFVAINTCHGTLIPMIDATVVDHLDQLGGDYGRLRLWGSLSFIIGAAGSAPLVGAYGPSVIPWLLVAPQILLAPVLLFLPRGQRGLAEHARAPWALLTPALVAFLATVFLVQASTARGTRSSRSTCARSGCPTRCRASRSRSRSSSRWRSSTGAAACSSGSRRST